MSWSGGISADSGVNASTTFTPEVDANTLWQYHVVGYTFPKKGLYRIQLYGSSGRPSMYTGEEARNAPGRGGYTEYYREFEAGAAAYLGCGAYGACAFIASSSTATNIQSLQYIPSTNVYAVAGGGGTGGYIHDTNNRTQYNCVRGNGGAGGGSSGLAGANARNHLGGAGGTQSSGEGYGKAGRGGWGSEPGYYGGGGEGGDGYYGGKGGEAAAWDMGGADAAGGGGGSSYVKEGIASQVNYNGSVYTNATSSSGPESGTGYIVITFVQEPNGVPTPPSSVWLNKSTADVLGESCTISWNGATAGYKNTIIGYDIYRDGAYYTGINTDQTYGSAAVPAPTNPSSSYTYSILTRVTPTRYSVLSNGVTLSTSAKTAPSAPTGVMINSTTNCYIGTHNLTTLIISWNASTAGAYNNVTSYHIYKDNTLLGGTTETSFDILSSSAISHDSNNNFVGNYYVYAIGSGGNNSAGGGPATVNIIAAPSTITLTSGVPEVTASNLYMSWNGVSAPTGTSSLSYYLAFMTSSDTAWQYLDSITNTAYTFPIEKVNKGKNFTIGITTRAYGSGSSYTPSSTTTLSSGRVGFFNMPSPFFSKVYDNAANDVKTEVNAFGYGTMSIYWNSATMAEASGNIFTYTLKCKIGNGAWTDIYSITKSPTSSDYGQQLLYSYNLASVGEGTVVYFYCTVRDNYGSELSSETIPITRLTSPTITNVATAITYKKVNVGFSGRMTTPNLNDTLTYNIYLGYDDKYDSYNNGTIDSTMPNINANCAIDLTQGANANTNTFIGALYDKVITQKYPRPNGRVRIEVYYSTYPQCKANSYPSITYNFKNDISNSSGLGITVTTPPAHPTYFNSGDKVNFSFASLAWTDAAGGTSGANITYTFADNIGANYASSVSPNTTITQIMPTFIQDTQVVYTITARVSYADGTSQSKVSTTSFWGARWYNGDVLSISNAKPGDEVIIGNWILPSALWSSSQFGNLAKVELSLLNGDNGDTPFTSGEVSKTLTSFTSKIISFSIADIDLTQDTTIRAKAICTNTSGNSFTVYSSYYLVRSSAVTMALRKGSLGLNVSGSFNPSSTESTLYVNAKPNGTAPTVVISDGADQTNSGKMIDFQKGGTSVGTLVASNGYLYGKRMGDILSTIVTLGGYSPAGTLQTVVFTNDILKNNCQVYLTYPTNNLPSKKISKAIHISKITHSVFQGTVTIEYYLSHSLPENTRVVMQLHVVNVGY